MQNEIKIGSPVKGLDLRIEWDHSEGPDFTHHGRFINDPSEAEDSERVLKNPSAWRGDEQFDSRRHGYFAVSAELFDYEVREIYPHADDSPAHDAAVGTVSDRWARLIRRLADGDVTFLDVRVVVSAWPEGRQRVDIGLSEFVCDYEVGEDETIEDAARACVADNGLIDGALADAERVLAFLRTLDVGAKGAA